MEYNEKQIQIIETAERLFANNGYEGTSVRDIAQDAGINIAMISYYFGSKEKLLGAIFAYRISYTRITLENVLNNENYTPLQKVNKTIDSYIDKMMGNQCFYRLLSQERAMREMKNISGLVYESKKKNLELLQKIIHEGQKTGEFRKNIDIPLVINTLVGTSNSLINSLEFYKRVNNLENMPEEDFQKYIKKKLNHHLKQLFKSFLTYDA